MLGIAVRTARVAALTGLIAAGLAVLPTAPASAGGTVLTVTTTADVVDAGDGLLSLREAVGQASADSGVTSILLAEGATYQLDRCDVINEDGTLHLHALAGELTVVGGGSSIVQTCEGAHVLDADEDANVEDPVAALALEDLTLTTTAEDANGIMWTSVPTTLDGVTLTGTYGSDAALLGSAGLTVVDSTFEDLEGDAHIIWAGALDISRSVIIDSTASIGIQGAIEAEDVEISGNTFSANTLLPINQLDLLRVEVRGNRGNGAGVVLGGALGGTDPPLVAPFVVRDSVFRSNSTDGPGEGADPWCCPVLGIGDVDVDVRGTTFVTNVGFAQQVGMWAEEEEPQDLSLQNSTVAVNMPPHHGNAAAVASEGGVELEHVTILSSTEPSSDEDDVRVQVVAGSLESTSSYVVGALVPSCQVGGTTSHGGNVSTDQTCGFTEPDDRQDVPSDGVSWDFSPPDPADPLPVMRPIGDDPGLDLRTDPDCGASLPLDQIGQERPQGAGCDTGAVEMPAEDPVPSFSDVPPSHPFFDDISWAAAEGIADGFEDGTYRQSLPVSRQAMAAFLYRMAGEPPVALPTPPTFDDVSATHPFVAEVEWLADSGIASGFSDRTFRPSLPVSRQAMAAFLYRRALEPAFSPAPTPVFPDVGPGNPFRLEVEWLASEGITEGYDDGTFRPTNPVSRQAMAAFLHRVADD
jgi:hypothetical protein